MSVEVELKLALSDPAALPALLAALPAPRRVVAQDNRYFVDPEGLLAQARVMVRLRREDVEGRPSTVTLTLKRRTSKTDGVFVAREDEAQLPLALWERVIAGDADLADAPFEGGTLGGHLGVQSLQSRGGMRNRRVVVDAEGYVLEVDETHLPGGRVDAEVEVETADPEGARQVVEAAAARAGVSLAPQTRGKYSRFLEALAANAAR